MPVGEQPGPAAATRLDALAEWRSRLTRLAGVVLLFPFWFMAVTALHAVESPDVIRLVDAILDLPVPISDDRVRAACSTDLDGSGEIDIDDLTIVLTWGPCQ